MSDDTEVIVAPTSLAELTKDMNRGSVYTTDQVLAEVAKARTFLPYIKIASSQSKLVTKDKICAGGDFLMYKSKTDIVKLGPQFQCIPLAHRVKAMAFTADKTLTYFDPTTKEFLDTKEKSKVFSNNCMSGVEILFWIPEHDTFATFYCYNVTALNQVQTIRGRYDKVSILKSEFIETANYNWYGPQILACSEKAIEPDLTLAASVIKDFCNPKSSEAEAVTAEEGGTAERAR